MHFGRSVLCVHVFSSRPNYFSSPSSLLNYCGDSRIIVTPAGSSCLRNLLHSALNWTDLKGHSFSCYLFGNVSVVKVERRRFRSFVWTRTRATGDVTVEVMGN